MGTVSVRFHHGLGDLVHFAHLLQLWLRRGHEIAVETHEPMRAVFEASGIRTLDAGQGERDHPWMHGLILPYTEPIWHGNKVAHNLRASPLPDIGAPESLWDELLSVRLSMPRRGHRLSSWRPIVVCHLKGDSGVLGKNYPDWACLRFQQALLASPRMDNAEIVLVDGRGQTPGVDDSRVRHWKPADIQRLADLIHGADLVVGVDSGVLHLARMTNTPALGVWTEHAPWFFALPRRETRHLTQIQGGEKRMRTWNCMLHTDDDTHPERLAAMALEML